MDRGRIVEIGNHDQLMAIEGHYYKLYQAQARNVDTEQEIPAQHCSLAEQGVKQMMAPDFSLKRDSYGQLVLIAKNGDEHKGDHAGARLPDCCAG